MGKVQTTKIKGGAEYAKVADRLNEFRSANPRSKISIKFSYNEKGDLTHHAYIWKDMLDKGAVTTWEKPEPTRSDCHAWGAHLYYHYFASLAGIRS